MIAIINRFFDFKEVQALIDRQTDSVAQKLKSRK